MSSDNDEDIGFHFLPTPEELIEEYLKPMLRGSAFEDIIATKDVYAMEPWLLVDHTTDSFFMEDVYYYFSSRKQISEKKIGYGKNSKRRITGDDDGIDRGFWRQNSKKTIIEEKTGNIIGEVENLTYIKGNNKKQKTGDGGASPILPGSESSWIMNQYMLPDDGTFQELVLCKIHRSKKSKKKDHLHESSASSEQPPTNINSECVVAASSEIPHVPYPCSRGQSGEANMVPQIDALSMTERVPEDKDEQVGTTHDSTGAVFDMLNTMNGSSFPMEEGGNTPSTGQNFVAQFTSLGSTKSRCPQSGMDGS